MNEKLRTFLAAQKEKKAAKELKTKNKHLMKLGLTEDGHTPIEVTDEEYEEICKYCPPKMPRTMEERFPVLLHKVKAILFIIAFHFILSLIVFLTIVVIAILIWLHFNPNQSITIHL